MALEGPNDTIKIETYREGLDDSAMIPAGAPPREVGESFYDWSIRTGLMPLLGPGDLDEIISEPDYERMLRKSVRIFGGTVDDYRTPGMNQEQWAAIGTTWHPGSLGECRWTDPNTEVGDDFAKNGFLAPGTTFAAQDFFAQLEEMPTCCLSTLGKATESLAVLERDLFRKASDALDEAWRVASRRSDVALLLQVANAYRDLAQAAS